LLFLDPGSEIRDLGSGMGKNQDPGSGINIPDPQHWFLYNERLQQRGTLPVPSLTKEYDLPTEFLLDQVRVFL
jgi:hypothetical protein